MEIYNFFSELLEGESGKEKLKEIEVDIKELNPVFVHISERIMCDKRQYTLIGQLVGSDTNLGDEDLASIFYSHSVLYTWVNARHPESNNILK